MVSVLLQLVFIAVLNAAGQLSLKLGSGAMSSLDRLAAAPLSVFNFPFFLLGGALYATSLVLYVNALSKTRLSVAYPFMGLTYVLVVAAAAIVLREPVGPRAVVGALLVFLGVSLIGTGMNA